jgi:ABC-type nitrate/sulfonate/bicarbonate transport system substrate-binding protein
MVNIGDTDPTALLSSGKVDIIWIFYGWEGLQAKQQGVDIDVVMMKDYFKAIPDYYTPIVITNENMIAGKPEVVRAFLKAISRGYDYAIQHPDDAASMLLKAAPELDANLVKTSQRWLSPYYKADATRWGEQKTNIWQDYTDWMVKNGLLKTAISVQDAFTNKFLP